MSIAATESAHPFAQPPAGAAGLPDFCSVYVVFIVVICAELLAFVLSLGVAEPAAGRWVTLALLSLFVQWVALSCTALLCLARRQLLRLGDAGAAFAAWLLITGVTGGLSWFAIQLLDWFGSPGAFGGSVSEFMLRAVAIAAILGAVVLRYFYLQAQNHRRLQAESSSRLQALQARMRPHFMFNALNTIAALTRSRPALAEEMVEDLADLLRASLNRADRPVSLAVELDLVRGYLRMESLRLGERLRWSIACEDPLAQLMVPPLLLQPLVENAVYHGIEPLPDGGEVRIEAGEENGMTVLTVSNPKAPEVAGTQRSGLHMALENTAERVRLHFGRDAKLRLVDDEDMFRVRIEVPGRENRR
jgi:two-component system sensor histidine kinase AlgZ